MTRLKTCVISQIYIGYQPIVLLPIGCVIDFSPEHRTMADSLEVCRSPDLFVTPVQAFGKIGSAEVMALFIEIVSK